LLADESVDAATKLKNIHLSCFSQLQIVQKLATHLGPITHNSLYSHRAIADVWQRFERRNASVFLKLSIIELSRTTVISDAGFETGDPLPIGYHSANLQQINLGFVRTSL